MGFFATKDTNGHEKNSWEIRRIPAVKAASHEFFSGLFVNFVV
jgi:hypothetical protein